MSYVCAVRTCSPFHSFPSSSSTFFHVYRDGVGECGRHGQAEHCTQGPGPHEGKGGREGGREGDCEKTRRSRFFHPAIYRVFLLNFYCIFGCYIRQTPDIINTSLRIRFCFSPVIALSPHPPSLPSPLSHPSQQEKRQGGGHKGHWAATDDGTLMVIKGSLDKDDPNYDSAVRAG